MESFFSSSKSKTSENATSSKGRARSEKKELPWVEKYRPKSVGEVVHQDEVVAVLKKTVQGADLPNLLFYGPPGTGKTSAILAVSRELYGDEMMKMRVLELNASDERGIQVVRDKIKSFAQQAVSQSTRPDGLPSPPFKIVILDEADSMTSSAQAALRRTMEKQSKNTRFCLICNYISRIIEPLTSRCAKFRFKPLDTTVLTNRLEFIATSEGVAWQPGVFQSIVEASEGDLRKAITFLQSAYRLKGTDDITKDDIMEIAGVVPQVYIDTLLKVCYSDSYEQLNLKVCELITEGFSASQSLSQLHDEIVAMDGITDKQKSIIAERMGLVDKRLMDGADEFLQLMDLCSVIMAQLCHTH